MRFGVCSGAENVGIIEAAGFDYIELAIAGALKPETPESDVMPALKNALGESQLIAEAYNVLLPGDLRVVGVDVDPSRQAKYLDEAFQRVTSLGGKIAVFGSGAARYVPEGYSATAARQDILNFLAICGDAAARHDVTLVIEPLNTSECNIINSVSEGMEYVLASNHPSVRVLSDLYHVDYNHQSYDETKDAGSYLKHVHVAGAQDRRAPITADIEFLIPYFRVLKEIGYDDRISVEGGWTDIKAQIVEVRETLDKAWTAA